MKFQFFKGAPVRLRASWLFLIVLGSGAGYKKGRTLYLAWNSASWRWFDQFRGGRMPYIYQRWEHMRLGKAEFGFARNANVIPWVHIS